MTTAPVGNPLGRECERCGVAFVAGRKDQRYCCRPCQKAATNNNARGPRKIENAHRNRNHFERAAWLSYDLNRKSPAKQRYTLLALLEAASGHDAALRNILLDPALLGADRFAPIGKLYPDTKSPETLNIAKMVHAFCMAEWGCSVRDAILDDGKPAGRVFKEGHSGAIRPPHLYNGP